MDGQTIWTAIGAIAGLMTAVATFKLVEVVGKQWRSQIRQLQAQNLQLKSESLERLHRDLISDEIRDALITVFRNTPRDFLTPGELAPELLGAAEKVLNHYDLIGHRMQAKTVPKSETIKTEWQVVLRVAQQLLPFVSLQALKRGAPYKQGFLFLLDQIRQDSEVQSQLSKVDTTDQDPQRVQGEYERLCEMLESGNGSHLDPFTRLPRLPVVPRGPNPRSH